MNGYAREAVGKAIKKRREELGLTQRQAVAIYNQLAPPGEDISPASWSHWETGRSGPDPECWAVIEQTLELPQGQIARLAQRPPITASRTAVAEQLNHAPDAVVEVVADLIPGLLRLAEARASSNGEAPRRPGRS